MLHTSIYTQEKHSECIPNHVDSIEQSLNILRDDILSLDAESTVELRYIDNVYQIKLGRLGTYVIDSDVRVLNQVAYRLVLLLHSPRFIKAILGQWPA